MDNSAKTEFSKKITKLALCSVASGISLSYVLSYNINARLSDLSHLTEAEQIPLSVLEPIYLLKNTNSEQHAEDFIDKSKVSDDLIASSSSIQKYAKQTDSTLKPKEKKQKIKSSVKKQRKVKKRQHKRKKLAKKYAIKTKFIAKKHIQIDEHTKVSVNLSSAELLELQEFMMADAGVIAYTPKQKKNFKKQFDKAIDASKIAQASKEPTKQIKQTKAVKELVAKHKPEKESFSDVTVDVKKVQTNVEVDLETLENASSPLLHQLDFLNLGAFENLFTFLGGNPLELMTTQAEGLLNSQKFSLAAKLGYQKYLPRPPPKKFIKKYKNLAKIPSQAVRRVLSLPQNVKNYQDLRKSQNDLTQNEAASLFDLVDQVNKSFDYSRNKMSSHTNITALNTNDSLNKTRVHLIDKYESDSIIAETDEHSPNKNVALIDNDKKTPKMETFTQEFVESEKTKVKVHNPYVKEVLAMLPALKKQAEKKANKAKAIPNVLKDSTSLAAAAIKRTDIKKPKTKFQKRSQAKVNKSKEVELKGFLIGADFYRNQNGHFEIGLFTKVNSKGQPVGAPLLSYFLQTRKTQFKIRANKKLRGYIFACFVGHDRIAKTFDNCFPFKGSAYSLAEYGILDAINIKVGGGNEGSEIAAVEKIVQKQSYFRGRVSAMFAPKRTIIPLGGATIKLRGTKYIAKAKKDGGFLLSIPKAEGEFLLEISHPGYMTVLKKVVLNKKEAQSKVLEVELASRQAIEQMASALGINQSSSLSVYIAKAHKDSKSLPGVSLQLSLASEGPFYFDKKGFPNAELRSTSFDGRAIFFNVEAGVGFMESFILGNSVVPYVVSATKGGDLIVDEIEPIKLSVSGRIQDPISAKGANALAVSGARIRTAGGVDWTESDVFGQFELPEVHYVRGSKVLLEISAKGLYNHRYELQVPDNTSTKSKKISIFGFPQDYINGLANAVEVDLNPYSGLMFGSLSVDQKIRIDALADHSRENLAKDYYFDEKNVIQGSYSYTNKDFGTFSIFDVPTGRVLLYGRDEAGELRYSKISYFSPSTINIILE